MNVRKSGTIVAELSQNTFTDYLFEVNDYIIIINHK